LNDEFKIGFSPAFGIQNSPLRILVTPLDWGLGHATRCIPIINELVQRGCTVSIATSGGAFALLRAEFPDLVHHPIVSYGIQYQTSGSFFLKMVFQLPKLLKAISQERKQIEKIVQANSIDVIISDNRFGCRSRSTKNIFITHQINILPQSFPLVRAIASYWNIRTIKKFDQCWVPDLTGSIFSGILSRNNRILIRHIGILSRFRNTVGILPLKYKLLSIISGPEPQRGIFEKLVSEQAHKVDGMVLVVRGIPETEQTIRVQGNVTQMCHLTTLELQEAILSSEFILCRSGYSSVMDLIALAKKNVIMVPTPGQPEQKYLAAKLHEEKKVYVTDQANFNLTESMLLAKDYNGFDTVKIDSNLLKEAIDELLSANPIN